jgi:hypothetical protein
MLQGPNAPVGRSSPPCYAADRLEHNIVLCDHGCGDQHTKQSHTHQASFGLQRLHRQPTPHAATTHRYDTFDAAVRDAQQCAKNSSGHQLLSGAFVSPLINNQHYTLPVQLHMRMLHTLAQAIPVCTPCFPGSTPRGKQATPPYIQTLIRLTLVGARIQCAHWGAHSPLANGRLGMARAAAGL